MLNMTKTKKKIMSCSGTTKVKMKQQFEFVLVPHILTTFQFLPHSCGKSSHDTHYIFSFSAYSTIRPCSPRI